MTNLPLWFRKIVFLQPIMKCIALVLFLVMKHVKHNFGLKFLVRFEFHLSGKIHKSSIFYNWNNRSLHFIYFHSGYCHWLAFMTEREEVLSESVPRWEIFSYLFAWTTYPPNQCLRTQFSQHMHGQAHMYPEVREAEKHTFWHYRPFKN